jgi:hypothetical protein
VCGSRSFAEKAASRLRGATVSGREGSVGEGVSALLLMQPGGNHSGRELVKVATAADVRSLHQSLRASASSRHNAAQRFDSDVPKTGIGPSLLDRLIGEGGQRR